ncbi:carbonic anhydrase 5A, mitochondrial isoform X1 [Arapaima gigas]
MSHGDTRLAAAPPAKPGSLRAAGGDRQSPIDIVVQDTVHDPRLQPLSAHYRPGTCRKVWNNGYTFLVLCEDTAGACSALSGGPLHDQYQLHQFHFHWGDSDNRGSEHSVDQNLYPAELHFVHWNSSQCRVFEDAMKEDNGLVVIGVFLKRHKGLQKLLDILPAVRHKGGAVEFTDFDPHCLLPECMEEYWTYPGSLTTPPMTEGVTWIIMRHPIEVSQDQVFFRTLLFTSPEEECQKYMVNNFRNQQPLKGRTVHSSFPCQPSQASYTDA